MKRNQRGFTLMELMVVIVIVAILAAVAVPLYTNYVKDAQRTEAKGAIGAVVAAEQVYLQRSGGTSFLNSLSSTQGITDSLKVDLTEAKLNWDFAVSPNGNADDGFTVTATGKGAANNLVVTYKHSRQSGPVWTEQ